MDPVAELPYLPNLGSDILELLPLGLAPETPWQVPTFPKASSCLQCSALVTSRIKKELNLSPTQLGAHKQKRGGAGRIIEPQEVIVPPTQASRARPSFSDWFRRPSLVPDWVGETTMGASESPSYLGQISQYTPEPDTTKPVQ